MNELVERMLNMSYRISTAGCPIVQVTVADTGAPYVSAFHYMDGEYKKTTITTDGTGEYLIHKEAIYIPNNCESVCLIIRITGLLDNSIFVNPSENVEIIYQPYSEAMHKRMVLAFKNHQSVVETDYLLYSRYADSEVIFLCTPIL